MFDLYILENIFGNGFKQNGLILISILSIIFGIFVITSKNPVRSVLFLIGLFLTISLYLFALNISFIALAYLLVYVGAVSILFLFILMLINVRVSELTTDNSNSIPLSIIIIAIFSLTLSGKYIFYGREEKLIFLYNKEYSATDLYNEELIDEDKVTSVFSCLWDSILAEMSHITTLGNILYSVHSTGIIIVGLILLLSMIGAISVTATSNNKS